MNIKPYNPLKDMENLFSRFLYPAMSDVGSLQEVTASDWMPSVDISESETEYTIKVEVPEVDKKDIHVELQDDRLSIKGERRKETKDEKEHRVERFYGSFYRSFKLPEDVSKEDVSAEQKDGMLYLHLRKHKVKEPKATEIKVS